MKKYINPDISVMEIELEQMIATSDLTVDTDPGTSEDPENADSRLFFELMIDD